MNKLEAPHHILWRFTDRPIHEIGEQLERDGNYYLPFIPFNDWLDNILQENKLSLRELAGLSRVDHSTLSRELAGSRDPSMRTVYKIARIGAEVRDFEISNLVFCSIPIEDRSEFRRKPARITPVQAEESFGQQLEAYIKASRISLRQLAIKTDMNHSTLSRLVSEDRVPSLSTFARLAQGFGLDESQTVRWFDSIGELVDREA